MSAGHGPYSPLRGAFTDSECDSGSEEELHNSIRCSNLSRPDSDSVRSFPDSASTAILSPSKPPDSSPSSLRKVAVVMSSLFCVFTVVAFLWLLPCSSTTDSKSGASGWENPYHDIELRGVLYAVEGANGRDKNLVGIFRGDVFNPSKAEGGRASDEGGLLLVVGNSGKVGWFVSEKRQPRELDCGLIDVNRDGRKDCLMSGERGLLAAVEPLSGEVHWYLHRHNDDRDPFFKVQFPLILPDLDSDGVAELLVPVALEESDDCNSLAIVSGYRGSATGRALQLKNCTSIDKLQLDERRTVSFTCRNSTGQSESFLTLDQISKQILNKPPPMWNDSTPIDQHLFANVERQTETRRELYSIAGRKLIVENRGTCPEDCRVSVKLVDERNSIENVSWEYSAASVYAMVPAVLNFTNNPAGLKNHASGFVLKFWQWSGAGIRQKRSEESFSAFSNSRSSPITVQGVSRIRRRLAENVSIEHLMERVILVTFNSTDVRVVNASQSDVVQICNIEGNCQPNINNQENSLLITDLDGDGSRELVTYLSTFVCSDENIAEEYPQTLTDCNSWRLRSTIRVVRLEAELPKLYEAVSNR